MKRKKSKIKMMVCFIAVTISVNSFLFHVFAFVPSSKEYIENYVANNYIGLSTKQMIEDYEYFFNTLNENYPYFGVAQRMDIHTDEIYDKYLQQITSCNNDFLFYHIMQSMINEFKGLGHLNIIRSYELEQYIDIYYKAAASSKERFKHYKPWLDTLLAPYTLKNYALYQLMDNPPELKAILSIENKQTEYIKEFGTQSIDWLEGYIIEPGKIAYLKIDSFGYDLIEKSRPVIMDFFEKAEDCENLIIDITENEGGAYDFWQELLAAPNVEEEIKSVSYSLLKQGENNKKYIDFTVYPINQLPSFQFINEQDLNDFDGFYVDTTVIKPSGNQKAYNGKIWLLVSPRVYSASENFAVFCKNTGFATVVGTPTGGDGIGYDPVFMTLPHSGILIKYSFDYGLNSDGSSNEEFGTLPHIISPEGEMAIETCFKQIESFD